MEAGTGTVPLGPCPAWVLGCRAEGEGPQSEEREAHLPTWDSKRLMRLSCSLSPARCWATESTLRQEPLCTGRPAAGDPVLLPQPPRPFEEVWGH